MRDTFGLAAELRAAAFPLTGTSSDHDRVLERIGASRVVLLGEATHGTHEIYRERARITRRLLREKQFAAVCIEGDWPDAWRVDRWIRGLGGDADASQALAGFRRFPSWMWRNEDTRELVSWLRAENERRGGELPVRFFGLDLYSLHASIEAVIATLERLDPAAAASARHRYACFDHFGTDPQRYGWEAASGLDSCEDEVVAQLLDLRRRTAASVAAAGAGDDDLFSAEQNARLVRDAEAYLRALYRGGVESWNLRDRHMSETLEAIMGWLEAHGRPGKVVVWAHNSHIGDARATDMARRGELSLGQLVRERWGWTATSIGFTTAEGSVTAASDWDGPAERKRLRPPLPESWEAVLHEVRLGRFGLDLRDVATPELDRARLERAVGVVYLPRTERLSHYLRAHLRRQFDMVLHLDHTRAVVPLERTSGWLEGELPEAWPTGI